MEAPIAQRQPIGEAIDDPAAPLALTAVRAADDRKALGITALRVSHLTSATSFFINLSGRSKAQINAIVKSIEDDVLEQFGKRAHRQGKALGGWVCLDYDSVVVNVFSEDQRDFYGIDKFWAAAQKLDLSDVLMPDAPEAPTSASSEVDDDDWELGEDDDWDLEMDDDETDDGSWSLSLDEKMPTAAADADVEPAAVPFDFSAKAFADEGESATAVCLDDEDDDLDNPFADFAAEEAPPMVEEVEAVIATEEDEEAIERKLVESGLLVELDGDDDDDGADWALGDEQLRALVQKAEQRTSGSASSETASSESGSDWRSFMAEDGWEDVEDTLEEAPAADDDAEDAFFK